MSEEVQDKEVPEQDDPVSDAPATESIEQRAMAMGWRPREEFDGTDDEFIDAKEYVRRKPLFEKIEQQSRQLKQLTRAMESFKIHHSKVEEAAVTRAIAALRAERKQALTDGDGDRFEALDDQIKEAEQQVQHIKQEQARPIVQEEVVHPEFQAWVNKNSWYQNVSYMRKFADDVGLTLAQRGLSREEVLKEVEQAVRREFPQKFTNPNKASAPEVEGSRTPAGKTKGFGVKDLDPIEKRIMNDLVRSGTMTQDEYLAEIKKQRGQ